MTIWQKIRVGFLKLLGFFSMFGLSGYLVYDNFFDGSVSSQVELGMGFIIGTAIIFFIVLRMIARKKKQKEIAFEITKAMGKPTQGINPIFLEIWNWLVWIIPLGLLAWLEFLLGFYESSLYMVIIYIGGSLTLGFIFIIIATYLHQAFLRANEIAKEDELIKKIKE